MKYSCTLPVQSGKKMSLMSEENRKMASYLLLALHVFVLRTISFSTMMRIGLVVMFFNDYCAIFMQ